MTLFPFCAMGFGSNRENRQQLPDDRYRCRTQRFQLPDRLGFRGRRDRSCPLARIDGRPATFAGRQVICARLCGSAEPGSLAGPASSPLSFRLFDRVRSTSGAAAGAHARARTRGCAPRAGAWGRHKCQLVNFPSGSETNTSVTGRAGSPRHCDPGVGRGSNPARRPRPAGLPRRFAPAMTSCTHACARDWTQSI